MEFYFVIRKVGNFMYLGIDIGGTNVKYGVVNDSGKILDKSIISTYHDKNILLRDIIKVAEKYSKSYSLEGIGVSVPGIVQDGGYLLTGGSIKQLYNVQFKEEIESLTKLPIIVENDANSVAIAEKWIGNAINLKNYICIVLGTGVGGGIVINGELYKGAHGMAGEFGYMIMREFKEVKDIKKISLNQTGAVVGGLYNQYNLNLLKNGDETELNIDAKEIMKRAKDGNQIAINTLNNFYQTIATSIINLISSFDPEVVLIGGGISANEEFIQDLKNKFESIKKQHEDIRYLEGKTIADIKPAKLQNDAGIIGAAYLVRQSLKYKSMNRNN